MWASWTVVNVRTSVAIQALGINELIVNLEMGTEHVHSDIGP